ncbi:hypothetical protein [Mycobacterium interjectum]|uniref:hypothetical protein n=1 Tax=Mycobacterium interjectum TaxID=33895 RepID=UPI000AB122E2|nr:hypothetical protein [Mycobacterium interjectum]MCV7089618.1 hypothetical protein [Mycobacterium interjectum]
MTDDAEAFKPPYMSWQTFSNFIKELGAKPLPPRIDRSLMASKSGTDQANLTAALTSFGLVDEANNVLPLLQELTTADDEQRKAILAGMVTRHYLAPMEVSRKNGTSKDLEDAFRDSYPSIASPDVRRKSITFFLHAAREAGLELSVHFPKTRAGQGAPGATKPKRTPRRKGASAVNAGERTGTPASNGAPDSPPAGDTYTVELASGGSVSVVVEVNLFALTTEDRNFVIDLVDRLKGYKTPGTTHELQEESP